MEARGEFLFLCFKDSKNDKSKYVYMSRFKKAHYGYSLQIHPRKSLQMYRIHLTRSHSPNDIEV